MYIYTARPLIFSLISLSLIHSFMTAGLSSMAWIMRGRKEDSEARLDLSTRDLFGGVAVAGSAAAAELHHNLTPANRQLLDLNYPPASAFVNDSVDVQFHLVPAHAAVPSAVCTLEKVKLALERVERESRRSAERSPSLSSSTTTSSGKRRAIVEEGPESSSAAAGKEMILAGCLQCLVYVLVCKSEPRCPQCNSNMRVPATVKKPRIDLNSSSTD